MTFNAPQPTGVGDDLSLPYDRQNLVADPAVLQVSSQDWLMVYRQAVRQKPNVPQVDQPKNLYAARSKDGRTFERIGLILDSADNDSGQAEQPSLLLLPDGRLRLYYLSRGDRIASLVSEDKGSHWLREGERLSRLSLDPAAFYPADYYAVYYVAQTEMVTEQGTLAGKTSIRKAISTDGINFTKGSRALINGTPEQPVLDPSLVTLKDGSERLYFRQAASAGSNSYNLYYAALNKPD